MCAEQAKIRWGILSCARVARNRWIPALREINASISAIASRSLEKAQQWAHELDIPRAWGSYEQLLDDPEIDAVFIGLPNSLHHPWTLRALQAGKHVLCDKPLALNAEQAREMVRMAGQQNRLLMEGFMYQYIGQYEIIQHWLRDDSIGPLKMIRIGFSFFFNRPGDIRYEPDLGGGALLDLGCYCVNLIRRMAGTEPVRAFGTMTKNPQTGADWTTSAILEFPDGLKAVFDCSFAYQGDQFLDIVGTQGTISSNWPFTPKEEIILTLKRQEEKITRTLSPNSPYARCVEDFQNRLHSGTILPCPARDAICNLKVLDAVRQSALEHNPPGIEILPEHG
ncbi:MAG: Gfo/Idh/MocA family oxidoreductase [Sedimentisphaerales bacterium]|nr:Gfo/Idh/MocA family oxidoreductase [Sedimentisphaerales bacterium]